MDYKITNQDIENFKSVNVGLQTHFWIYDNGLWMAKFNGEAKPLTDKEIKEHLQGKIAIGLSPFTDNKNVLYGGYDLDCHTQTDKARELMIKEKGPEATQKYETELKVKLIKQITEDLPKLTKELDRLGYLYFVNPSSSGDGRHLRVYGNKPSKTKTI